MAQKTILIIGGGILQVPLIQTAKKMGIETVVTDLQKNAPGMLISNYPLEISTRDIDGTVRIAREFHQKHCIDGVITAGTDASMTVSAVANVLDLPGIKFTDAEAASNKIKMRTRFKEHSLASPEFIPVWSKEDAMNAAKQIGFPLVSKPADNMGARGVIKVYNIDQVENAYIHSKRNSPTGEVLFEEFMPGPELSIDALVWDGNIEISGIADRIIERDPYFVEIGHNMPSSLPEKHINDAVKVMKSGIKALGITRGAAKGDIKITPNGAKIGEIAARLSGGYMSSHTYPYSTGIDLLKSAIEISLGEEPSNLNKIQKLYCIERTIVEKPGKILNINGIKEVLEIPEVKDLYIHLQKGDSIKSLNSNIGKVGNIIICHNSLTEAVKLFEKTKTILKIEIDSSTDLTQEFINSEARRKLTSKVCIACKICDGKKCVSTVPGMGSVYPHQAFINNQEALKNISILPSFIHNKSKANTNITLFSKTFSSPIFAAPITGTKTNMNSSLSEEEYADIITTSMVNNNSLAFVGDGAAPKKYKIGLHAIKKNGGNGVAIFKPREDRVLIIERIKEAERLKILAVGIDIDSVNIKSFQLKNQATSALSRNDLEYLRKQTSLPFLLKGILTPADALLANDLGFDAIVVSNHGGRILSSLPATASILHSIYQTLQKQKSKMKILVDGGIRSGEDVFKMLALGADAVLIGRPFCINAIGAGKAGVELIYKKYLNSLEQAMNLCGKKNLEDINYSDIIISS